MIEMRNESDRTVTARELIFAQNVSREFPTNLEQLLIYLCFKVEH